MMHKTFRTLLVIMLFLFLPALLWAQENDLAITSNNQFAFDLYAKYRSQDGNIFFSPYSISSALAMTWEGANGKTAEEIQSVFHFPAQGSALRDSFYKVNARLNKEHAQYILNTANALWAQIDYPFLAEYTALIDQSYGGKATNLDFTGEAEASRQMINRWVEEQTKNKIKDLIPLGEITPMTRLVLTNAIYFKGAWHHAFDKKNTLKKEFRLTPEQRIEAVPMMSLEGKQFQYAETENLQILTLPYKGEELSMVIFLPRDENLASLEQSLNMQTFIQWTNTTWQPVNVSLPRFKFEKKYFMKNDLEALGMPTAFGLDADFSKMDGRLDLYLSQVIHQAFIDVNEEGTEAAAATASIMRLKGVEERPREPKIFNADHPFIFIIQDTATKNILFMGRMSDPRQ